MAYYNSKDSSSFGNSSRIPLINQQQQYDGCVSGSAGYSYPADQTTSTTTPASVRSSSSTMLMEDSSMPKILLMGLRRSGKSSIERVVFQKMSPHETLFLESSIKVQKHDVSNNSFVQFQIWDFPGQIDFFNPTFDCEAIFSNCGSLVFIIDSQDDTSEAEDKLIETVRKASEVNPNIVFEVFIHKVDGLSDDSKMDLHRNLQQRVSEELNVFGSSSSSSSSSSRTYNNNNNNNNNNVHLAFHQTSIYDHSIFEAFSKVIQKLIPQLPTLENLLDMFINNSLMEKAFLFDVMSKIYIATDSTPVDNATYELCSDMIDVVIDVSSIYGGGGNNSNTNKQQGNMNEEQDHLHSSLEDEGYSTSQLFPSYDRETSSIITLSKGIVLFLRQVNQHLALVCLMREENCAKFGLINYNFETFKQAIQEVFEVRHTVVKKASEKISNKRQ